MTVLPTEYPQLHAPASWHKVRDAHLLVRVTDTALRYGPLRWQGRMPKRWSQVGDHWVVNKPAAAQRTLALLVHAASELHADAPLELFPGTPGTDGTLFLF